MSGIRAARELRGDDVARPFTPRGERPSTASGAGRPITTPPTNEPAKAAEIEALRKELEETKLLLEKEKRSNRSLEQYLSETSASKEAELREAQAEARMHQAALTKAEQHAHSLEELYKGQVSKLTATVERLQSASGAGGAAGGGGGNLGSDSFAAVLREEMRVMQASFQLKLSRAAEEAQTKQLEASKAARALQEELVEEKRKNANLLDKLSRTAAAASSPTAAASSAASSSSSSSSFPAAPAAAARIGSAGASSLPASSSSSSAGGSGLGSNGLPAGALPSGAKPVIKPTKAK